MSNGFIVAVPVTKTSRGYFLYAHWSKAPAFAFYEVYNGKYRLIEVVDNPLKDVEGRGKGKFLLDLILSRKAQAVIVYSIGGGAFEWLRSAGVKIYVVDNMELVDNILEKLVRGELKEADRPPYRFKH